MPPPNEPIFYAVRYRDGRFLPVIDTRGVAGRTPRLYLTPGTAKQAITHRREDCPDPAEWTVVPVRLVVEGAP